MSVFYRQLKEYLAKLDVSVITSGNVILSTNGAQVRSDTSDGSDNKSVELNGGGGSGITRGAQVYAYGNEAVGATGHLYVRAGTVSGAKVVIGANGNDTMELDGDGVFSYSKAYASWTPTWSDASSRITGTPTIYQADYLQQGRILLVTFYAAFVTAGGTSAWIRITLPSGYTTHYNAWEIPQLVNHANAGVQGTGWMSITSNNTYLEFKSVNGGVWNAGNHWVRFFASLPLV